MDFYALVMISSDCCILTVSLDFYCFKMPSINLPGFLRLGLDVHGLVRVSTFCGNKKKAYSRKWFFSTIKVFCIKSL